MSKYPLVDYRKLAGALFVAGAVFVPYTLSAAAQQSTTATIYLAATNPDDAFEQAMKILKRPDGSKPSKEDVERAGHMLMDAGPDAFERAMQALKRPTAVSSDAEIATAKKEMMSGGPDAHTKAMNILMRNYGYAK